MPRSDQMVSQLALISALVAPSVAAAAVKPLDHHLTVNPIDLVNGMLSVELEGAFDRRISGYIAMNFLVWEGVWAERTESTFAIGPEVGLRLFLIGSAPEGLWFGPFGGIAYVDVGHEGRHRQAIGGYYGAMAGVTMVVLESIPLSLGAGAGFHDFGADFDGDHFGRVGPMPRLRVATGVAF